MKKLITFTAALILATTLLLQTGCGSNTAVTTPESNRWLELLRVMPENEDTLKAVYLQDNAYLEEKKQAYPQVSDEQTIIRIQLLFVSTSYNDEEWRETLGFTMADISQTVLAGVPPMDFYEAVRGQFSQADVEQAARTGPLNEHLETVSYQGFEYYSWGEDREIHLDWRSGVRKLGRGHRLAYVGDFAFWMLGTEGMEEMIDSYEGKIKSLADNEDYKLLAGILAELDVVTAFFSSETQSYSYISETFKTIIDDPGNNEHRQSFVEEIQREPRLKPYQAFATGAGLDEDGYYLAIVLLNPDEDTAEQNKTLLEQRINDSPRWSDRVSSMEIKSQGRLTTAKLYGTVAGAWSNFSVMGLLGGYEPLLIHE